MSSSLQTCLQHATKILEKNTQTAHLDAALLLAYVLNVSRAYLIAHAERELTAAEYAAFFNCIDKRRQGVPIAYLTGRQAFWSLDLCVTPATLIPRPDTETLIECALRLPGAIKYCADLGTGSGAIALALAAERSHWQICATDQSAAALAVAKKNALHNHATNVTFYHGHWCKALPVDKQFDLIVSNPPYLAAADPHIADLRYEPHAALVSGEDGLDAIREIILTAPAYLINGGYLLLEHGFDQAASVRELFLRANYKNVYTECDLAGLTRVTGGMKLSL